jgi:hypothetical protein
MPMLQRHAPHQIFPCDVAEPDEGREGYLSDGIVPLSSGITSRYSS